MSKRYCYETFSEHDLDETYEYFLTQVSPEKKPKVTAAKVMWFLQQDNVSEAANVFESLLRQGVPLADDMLTIKQMLDARNTGSAA